MKKKLPISKKQQSIKKRLLVINNNEEDYKRDYERERQYLEREKWEVLNDISTES